VVSIQGLGSGMESSGTGVIFNNRGHILTNLHVIRGMRNLEVTLSSHDRYLARVVGIDPATDLAVIGIAAGDSLHPAVFGDSDALSVGDEVLAIGNAYGFGWTVTQGIVSSLHRSEFSDGGLQSDEVIYTNFIQTDAAINPGNSGGPIVNLRGEVIGLASAIVSGSGASDGIGFAIPSADAAFVARELVQHGVVERGYLGIYGRSVSRFSREQRREMGVEGSRGAVVEKVARGSPAAAAGFRSGDIIVRVDGTPVEHYQVMRHRVARMSPGTELRFDILRDGRDASLQALLGRRPTIRGDS
jgi:S1-C subfamily serine protease